MITQVEKAMEIGISSKRGIVARDEPVYNSTRLLEEEKNLNGKCSSLLFINKQIFLLQRVSWVIELIVKSVGVVRWEPAFRCDNN